MSNSRVPPVARACSAAHAVAFTLSSDPSTPTTISGRATSESTLMTTPRGSGSRGRADGLRAGFWCRRRDGCRGRLRGQDLLGDLLGRSLLRWRGLLSLRLLCWRSLVCGRGRLCGYHPLDWSAAGYRGARQVDQPARDVGVLVDPKARADSVIAIRDLQRKAAQEVATHQQDR